MGFFSNFWYNPFSVFGSAVSFIVGVALFAFWIWMIIDCAKRKFNNDIEKIVWILVIVLGTWVGALVYFLVIWFYNPRGLAAKQRKR